jgi:aldose 1-epimerase
MQNQFVKKHWRSIMKISTHAFGQIEGRQVVATTVENTNGTRMTVLNLAGLWHEYSVLNANGLRQNLVLSSRTIEGYLPNTVNRIIGRVAGRIGNAEFDLNGETKKLIANNGQNSLHGGPNGLQTQFYEVTSDVSRGTITLTAEIDEATDNFPGLLVTTVVYALGEDDSVTISVVGEQANADGLFNPTSHVYFNLDANRDVNVAGQTLKVASKQHLELRNDGVPSGNLIENANTPFALDGTLGDSLAQLAPVVGFDDVFVIGEHAVDTPMASLSLGDGQLDVYSQRNGLVMYTANNLKLSAEYNRASDVKWPAVALEPQTLPDAINHPGFGDIVLQAGDTRTEIMKYHYHK